MLFINAMISGSQNMTCQYTTSLLINDAKDIAGIECVQISFELSMLIISNF